MSISLHSRQKHFRRIAGILRAFIHDAMFSVHDDGMRGREYDTPFSPSLHCLLESSHLLVVNKSTVSNGFGLRHASFPSAALLNPEALSDRTKLNLGLKSAGSLSMPPGLASLFCFG